MYRYGATFAVVALISAATVNSSALYYALTPHIKKIRENIMKRKLEKEH